jgi:hypothetical protein
MEDGRRYSNHPRAGMAAAWRVVQDQIPDKTQKQCRVIVNTWLGTGVLVYETYRNPVSREDAQGLHVIHAKLPT